MMRKTINKTTLLILVLAWVCTSCSQGPVFEKVHRFTDDTWQRIEEDIRFEVEITDENRRYDIDLPIRYTTVYPHQYLEISINIFSPSGQENLNVRKIYLVDENLRPRGTLAGEIRDYTFRLFDEYKFNEKGTYIIEFQNLTGNKFHLHGLSSLGLIITRAKTNKRD
jgi:gliding motility-associated lipoprotein GldH